MEAGPPVRAIIIACGLLAAFLFISFNIKISTDLSLFLPEPDSKIERLLRHQIDNGASSNLIFIALRNLPKQALAEINQVMTDALRQSPYFSKVTNNAGELGETELEFVERLQARQVRVFSRRAIACRSRSSTSAASRASR